MPSVVADKIDSNTGTLKKSFTLNPGQRLQKHHYRQPPSLSQRVLRQLPTNQAAVNALPALERTASEPPPSRPPTPRPRSVFGISGILNDFRYEVDRSFLSPVAAEIYRRVTTVEPPVRYEKLSQPDIELTIAPDTDSGHALAAIRAITKNMAHKERKKIVDDLHTMITSEQLNVLIWVLFSRTEIRVVNNVQRCTTPESVKHALRRKASRYVSFSAVQAGQDFAADDKDKLLDHEKVLDRERPITRTGGEESGIFVRKTLTPNVSRPASEAGGPSRISRLGLRGGGGDEDRVRGPSKLEKAATSLTTLYRQTTKPARLADDERPHAALWWLAGGRLRKDKPHFGVPTGATLRERKELERENREKVGFWGTVRGIREVKRVRGEMTGVCEKLMNPPKAENKEQGGG
jgi:hypothetical protein